MKLTLFSLLVVCLLAAAAHATETEVGREQPKQVELQIRLYEIDTAAAVAAGFDSADALTASAGHGARFTLPASDRPLLGQLDQLTIERTGKLLMETDLAVIDGFTGGVSQMTTLPDKFLSETKLTDLDPDAALFAGQMGYSFKFTPTVDDKDRITLAMQLAALAPGVQREMSLGENKLVVPIGYQSTKTTMRVKSGATICAANVIPLDTRIALANALQADAKTADHPNFAKHTPQPGTTLYLVVTPTVIVDR